MWSNLSGLILRHRFVFIVLMLLSSAFMFWKSLDARISFTGSKILPLTDSSFQFFNAFKKNFGEDGGVMVMGIKSKSLYEQKNYDEWVKLSNQLMSLKGVNNVLSTGHLFNLVKDSISHTFKVIPFPRSYPKNQLETDSIKTILFRLPFYKGFLYSENGDASLIAVSLDQKVLNSASRTPLVHKILSLGNSFSLKTNTPVHYSGLPYIRSILSEKVASEFKLFLGLSILASSIILFLFFRSALPVLCSMLVVILGVIWSLGILVLFGFQMTLLTALIPSLVVIIGIPNSTLLLNRYHAEFKIHQNRLLALQIAIEHIGFTTLIANLTTAIGFGVFFYTRSEILGEFGIVAFLSIMSTWMLSLVIIPILFSYIKPPSENHTSHLSNTFLKKVLDYAFFIAVNKGRLVYFVTLLLVCIGGYGISRIYVNAYIVDDLPKKDPVYQDLKFFEKNFKGILPFEVSIDTKRKNGVTDLHFLGKIDSLDKKLNAYGIFSQAVSLNKAIKFSRQAFFGGSSTQYQLPSNEEASFMSSYAKGIKQNSLLKNYVDSSGRTARVSFQMADAGSARMNTVLEKIKPQLDSIFQPSKYNVHMTGSSIIFIKGINYLVKNLFESLALAIALIAIIMIFLFKTFRMVLISLIPNLIPLVLTAGIMGFFHINLKPSTILIFSIAFGLASDQTIYFLTRYRIDTRLMLQDKSFISEADLKKLLQNTLQETGVSMIYAAVILFMGFSIFDASQFGGTVILGILVSLTLLFAIITNLVLLPALIYSLARKK